MRDIKDFFEADCIWQIPETDSCWHGNVYIRPGKEIRLKIIKFVSASEVDSCLARMPMKIKIIQGTGGNEITLLNGLKTAFSKSISGTTEQAKVESTYSFLYALIGELFSSEDEIKFKDVMVTFTNMSNWTEEKISKKLIEDVFIGEKGNSEVIPIFSNNNFELSIFKSFKRDYRIQQMSLKCYSELLIKSKDNYLDLYEYLKIAYSFAVFLSLSEVKNVYPQNVRAGLPDKIIDIYLTNNFSQDTTTVYSFEMLFTYENIKEKISQILENWFKLTEEETLFYDAWSTYFYYSNIKSISPSLLFILLMEALEAYHKKEKDKRWNAKIVLKDEINDKIGLELKEISNILKSFECQIEEEIYSTLMNRLNIFKDSTLKSAINDMLEAYRKITLVDVTIKDIPELKSLDQLIDVIVFLRNLLTHRDKRNLNNQKIIDYNNPKTIDKINNKIDHIIKVLLFADLGFPRQVINKEIIRYQNFIKNVFYLSDET